MQQDITSERVTVRFFLPSPQLAPYFSTYYLTEVRIAEGSAIDDWLHPEWANLRIPQAAHLKAGIGGAGMTAMPRLIATGPTSQASHFEAGPARIWGIGLLPLGWARFVGVPADAYADRTCDGLSDPAYAAFVPLVDQVFAAQADPVAEAARIDAYLLDLLANTPPAEDEARIRKAHAALIDDRIASVGDMAERFGLSARSLERFSARAFGFAPKLLLRRQRFLRSLAQFMLDPGLSWIRTLDCHYVDQAHFVRDFKRFMTMSPSAYAALDHPVMRAAASARAVAAGDAVQALHKP